MTAREMQQAFLQWLEPHFDYKLPQIISDDIQYYLNEAQKDMYDARFDAYEVDQVVTDDLSPFVVKQHVIDTLYSDPSYTATTYFIDNAPFPANYRHMLDSRLELQVANTGSYSFEITGVAPIRRIADTSPVYTDYVVTNVKPRLAQHDDINTLMQDPFHKTLSTEPLVTISASGLDVYTDSTFIADKVIIDYIKNPTEINITQGTDSEFPTFLHRELVELAVRKYLSLSINNKQTVNE